MQARNTKNPVYVVNCVQGMDPVRTLAAISDGPSDGKKERPRSGFFDRAYFVKRIPEQSGPLIYSHDPRNRA